ncbi:MAG: hypothetical protein HRT43_09835 [Campylobacteraceae bacterium]|nr:hypothetical protein [Campylobacteraceae bacterium]
MNIQLIDIEIKIAGQKLSDDILKNMVTFKVHSSIGIASIAKITFFDQNFTLQDNSSFAIGKTLEISVEADKKPNNVFNGFITRVDYVFQSEKMDTLQLICYDGLYKLSKAFHSRAFLKSKISDIASKMATEVGLSSQITATTTKHDHIYQNNQSNLDFLQMHAKRLGYELGVVEGKFYFEKAKYKSKKTSPVSLEWGEDLINFTAKIDTSEVLAEVAVNSWDSLKKANVESVVKAGSETKIGSVKTLGTSILKKSLKDGGKIYKQDSTDLDTAQAKDIAETHLTMASMNFLKAQGTCKGDPRFKLGEFIKIEGVGDKISGDYYISSYEHIFNNKGFKTSFEIKANGMFT